MSKERWLRTAERLIPLLLALIIPMAGGVWAVYVYTQSQAELAAKRAIEEAASARTRLVELQKPFIDEQFRGYKEFVEAIGDLLANRAGSEKWLAARLHYLKLHWSSVALVEDDEVHSTKNAFMELLEEHAASANVADQLLKKYETELKKVSGDPERVDEIQTVMIKILTERDRLRPELEKASVPLTTALRKSLQKSWTGNLGN